MEGIVRGSDKDIGSELMAGLCEGLQEFLPCGLERFEVIGCIIGKEHLFGVEIGEEVDVVVGESCGFESPGELGGFRLVLEHIEYPGDMVVRAGEKIIVEDVMALCDGQFSNGMSFPSPDGAEPAFVWAATGRDDVSRFEVESRDEVGASVPAGRPSH